MLFQEWDDEPAPVVLDPQTAVPIHADARPLVSFTGQHAPALAAWGPFVYIATTTHLVQLGAGYGYSVPGRLYRSVQWHADDAPANRQPWLAVVSEVLYCGWTDGGDIVMRSLASLEVLGTTRWAAPDPDANDVVKVVSDGRCLVRVTLVGVSSSKDAAEPSASVGAPSVAVELIEPASSSTAPASPTLSGPAAAADTPTATAAVAGDGAPTAVPSRVPGLYLDVFVMDGTTPSHVRRVVAQPAVAIPLDALHACNWIVWSDGCFVSIVGIRLGSDDERSNTTVPNGMHLISEIRETVLNHRCALVRPRMQCAR